MACLREKIKHVGDGGLYQHHQEHHRDTAAGAAGAAGTLGSCLCSSIIYTLERKASPEAEGRLLPPASTSRAGRQGICCH